MITERPDVDASVITWNVETADGWLAIPIRNVGAGLARVEAAFVTVDGEDALLEVVDAESEGIPTVLPAGEIRELIFTSGEHARLHALVTSDDGLVVEVSYTDVSGRQRQASILYLAKTDQPRRRMWVRDLLPATDLRLTAEPRLMPP